MFSHVSTLLSLIVGNSMYVYIEAHKRALKGTLECFDNKMFFDFFSLPLFFIPVYSICFFLRERERERERDTL